MNEVVWERKDSEITWLTFWKEPTPCESCGKPTHLVSHGDYGGERGIGHPVCEECYKELHGYHVAYAEKIQEERQR